MEKIRIEKGNVSAAIDMAEGMNAVSIEYQGKEVIECNETRRANGATYAVPVLFPTPNRTAGGCYSFRGENVDAIVHGYARHSAFSVIDRSCSSVTGFCDFESCSAPYSISMKLKIEAFENSLTWNFTIENRGEKEFPFSVALHPFFRKDIFEYLTLNADYEMEATSEKLPTGRLIKLNEQTGYNRRLISDINADTVYFSEHGAIAELDGDGFTLVISASPEFKHSVVYGYPGSSFICVEPQTGSTDFVNLHERGFEKAASLISLKKGESRNLFVDFCFR